MERAISTSERHMNIVVNAFDEETVAANIWEVIDLVTGSGLSDFDVGIAVADGVKWGYLTYGLNGIIKNMVTDQR